MKKSWRADNAFEDQKKSIDKAFLTAIGKPEYPSWICGACAMKNGGYRRISISTYHNGTCGWCGEEVVVTEPRDWGYPNYNKTGGTK
jgi:hypothetical protein